MPPTRPGPIVITGASHGVGAATARYFAAQSRQVVLVARSRETLQRLAAEIGPKATPIPCDAADPAAVARMSNGVLSEIGAPLAVINCAGAGQWKTLPETTPEELDQMMRAPTVAAQLVSRAFLPAMLANGKGVLVHVNSPACIAPWPSSVGYATARFALRGFHKALAQDLRGTGVQSCHVIFGKISSDYFNHNPGTLERMPTLARTMPTLSPETCAKILARYVAKPRHEAIHPGMLRFELALGGLCPPLMRWLARL